MGGRDILRAGQGGDGRLGEMRFVLTHRQYEHLLGQRVVRGRGHPKERSNVG